MSRELFNTTSSGTFEDSTTFARPLTTANAIFDSGVDSIIIDLVTSDSSLIPAEPLLIRGIFLNIDSVAADSQGTFTIKITDSNNTVQNSFTYQVSSIYSNFNTNSKDNSISQHWQGFDLENVDLFSLTNFKIAFSCSLPGEVSLIGDSTTNVFNKYIVPSNATDFVSATPNFKLHIGSYLTDINSGDALLVSNVSSCSSYSGEYIKVWSGSTLNIQANSNITLQGTTSTLSTGIIVLPAASLIIEPGSNVTLLSSSLIGLDSSFISISGTEKLPYTFLSVESPVNSNQFTTLDSVNTWLSGDRIFITGNTAFSTNEILVLNNNPSAPNTIDTTANSNFLHLATNSSSCNLYGDFYGAPILNLTRNTTISSNGSAFISVKKSCLFYAENALFTGLKSNLPAAPGAINLLNATPSTIKSCAIHNSAGFAVFIDNSKATSHTIYNNSITNSDGAIRIQNTPSNWLLDTVLSSKGESNISKNACIGNTNGISILQGNIISLSANIVSHSNNTGILVESPPTAIKDCNVFANAGNGIVCNMMIDEVSLRYPISNNVALHNGADGVKYTSNVCSVSIDHIGSGHNKGTGINLTATGSAHFNTLCRFVSANNNDNRGIVLNNIAGTISSANIWDNKEESLLVINCNKDNLVLYSMSISGNEKGATFTYPNLNGHNFFATYINDSNIQSGTSDDSCIVLDRTRCELFSINNTALDSVVGPCVKLIPASDHLIEGSYILAACNFTGTLFDDVLTKYQTDIYNEKGFVSMYEAGSNYSRRHTASGVLESDMTEYKNSTNQVSEKLTPNSSTKLKSSKKVVFLDNFDSSVPPNLEPEFLYVSVWVKKDANWLLNDNPRLVIASNPTLQIFSDKIIDEHTSNTTNWVQLTSLTPVASAVDSRGAIEMYVECAGTSGGSINIDEWSINILRS